MRSSTAISVALPHWGPRYVTNSALYDVSESWPALCILLFLYMWLLIAMLSKKALLRLIQKVLYHTILAGEAVFRLFDTFGFPPTLTAELAQERGLSIDLDSFNTLFKQHQERSRQANQEKFAGGLADHSVCIMRLHTATRLILFAFTKLLDKQMRL